MNRPNLVNFSAVSSENQLSIRASLTNSLLSNSQVENSPIDSVRLFSKESFRLKLEGINDNFDTVFAREYDSDNYGKFEIKIPSNINGSLISKLKIYETSQINGIDIHIGSFIPLFILEPKKIIISDFDKTLVDTKYSTPKEMYYSLNKPLSFFPNIDGSISKLKNFIAQDYQPFILSASPHFYENAIRDWLYQNKVFASNILLKDYRDFISIFDGPLTTKDIKKQGFYKLNQLIDVLLMTRIPNHLILMGDGFESDPLIYLTLKNLLNKHSDPWKIWKSIKNHSMFNLTSKQDSYFITKFYQINELAKKSEECVIDIYIRSTENNINKLAEHNFKNKEITRLNKTVEYYVA